MLGDKTVGDKMVGGKTLGGKMLPTPQVCIKTVPPNIINNELNCLLKISLVKDMVIFVFLFFEDIVIENILKISVRALGYYWSNL